MKQDIVGDLLCPLDLAEPLTQDRIGLRGGCAEISAHKIQTRRKLLPGDVTEVLAVLRTLPHLVAQGLVVPLSARRP